MTQIDNRPDRFPPVETLLQNRTRLMSDSASLLTLRRAFTAKLPPPQAPQNFHRSNLKTRPSKTCMGLRENSTIL
jgi:hypothetical protein